VGVGPPLKSVVTGGAGFIGSNLVDRLVSLGHEVTVIDNFATGREDFLAGSGARVVRGDLLSERGLWQSALEGADTVFHIAANADVRDGWSDPRRDFYQNVDVTLNVLEAAVESGVPEFVFTSTGSVYGEPEEFPTPETAKFPLQTSLYGASKISAESFIQAYAEGGKIRATIFRLVSVLGPRYTHGHVVDFVRKLKIDPTRLSVLGNGHQVKSYMNVADCVRALSDLRGERSVEVFNIGRDEFVTVRESLAYILDELAIDPVVDYGDEPRGWIGDNPRIHLDVSKAASHGWQAETSIEASVRETVRWLLANENL
jgi:UDP-glucose 4-epimerase